MLLVLLMLLSTQDESRSLTPVEGGVCTGLGWVTATEADKLSVDRGPDFRVIRSDRSQTDWWGIYVGRFAQVSRGKRARVFSRGGVKLDRVSVDGTFRGYLASDRNGFQNHFFGSPFKGDRSDQVFFDRVDFGPSGQNKCSRHPLP